MAEKKKDEEVSKELLKKLEDEAFARVCKAVGTTPAEIEAAEKQRERLKEMVEFDIRPMVVHINGKPFSHGRCTRGEWEVISQMAGGKRNRLLEEALGKKHQLIGSTLESRLVEVENAAGMKVNV